MNVPCFDVGGLELGRKPFSEHLKFMQILRLTHILDVLSFMMVGVVCRGGYASFLNTNPLQNGNLRPLMVFNAIICESCLSPLYFTSCV